MNVVGQFKKQMEQAAYRQYKIYLHKCAYMFEIFSSGIKYQHILVPTYLVFECLYI